jgi:2,4-dienoyl-CoA reductase-like NADH-dependent reductase (Old Yellow Enzyme family)/thioredoxin reductase
MERANGGVGLIIVESCYVEKRGKGFLGQLALDDNRYIPSLARLTKMVKGTGAKIVLQLIHCGRQTNSKLCGGQPVAPSPIPCPFIQEMPRELTTSEVKEIIQAFVDAAGRAKEADFDGVEIHAAHGYLVNQFLSSYSNKRTDQYGGDLFNRSKMLLEIVAKIKEQLGKDYPVLCRISAEEFVNGGLTLSETKPISQWLQNVGLDAISVSAGVYETAYRIIPPMDMEEGSLVYLAQGIKESVSIPVFAVGGISNPIFADQILIEGKADMVVIGRALLADPMWPVKAQRGEIDKIRPCLYCNHCRNRALRPKLNCAINYETGREGELALKRKSQQTKKVLVIGGGVAGMEAAYVASLRGHQVSLYEQSDELGGNLLLASLPPRRGRLRSIIEFLKAELERLGVKIFTKVQATTELIKQLKADVVLIATGSEPLLPDIPGKELPNVFFANEVLRGKIDVGKYVVVVGGGLVGLETADYLREQGKAVTIVEQLPSIGTDPLVETNFRRYLLSRLTRTDETVLVMTSTKVTEIGHDYVKVMCNSIEKLLPGVDSVVIAVGSKPFIPINPTQLRPECEVHIIGDAIKPQTLFEAVHSAAEVAYSI